MHAYRLALVLSLAAVACVRKSSPIAVLPNDNRTSAGEWSGDTLRVQLRAAMARWYPESDSGPFIETAAFAADERAAQVPGPLIRAPAGTTIRAVVLNTLRDTLLVIGLRGPAEVAPDTLRLPPGAVDSVETLVRAPGSFMYYGHTVTNGRMQLRGPGEQLSGAFVVDSTPARRMTAWS
jgi:FtsP/CotA-like multicopper oxidase with cupredoxin domain